MTDDDCVAHDCEHHDSDHEHGPVAAAQAGG
jgi:hypothetical protein